MLTKSGKTYIEILSDELFVAPKKDDYENFASYWTALDKHRKENDSKSCVNTLRALVASLQATDVPTSTTSRSVTTVVVTLVRSKRSTYYANKKTSELVTTSQSNSMTTCVKL